MSLGQTPPLVILELAEVGMMIKHPSPIWWTISANASSAVDLIPRREQLLSKGLRDELCERTDERMPLYTQGSSTLGSPAATKAGINCGQRGGERRWPWFCSELIAGEGKEQCLDRKECLFSVEPLGSPAGLGGQRQVLYTARRSVEFLLCG